MIENKGLKLLEGLSSRARSLVSRGAMIAAYCRMLWLSPVGLVLSVLVLPAALVAGHAAFRGAPGTELVARTAGTAAGSSIAPGRMLEPTTLGVAWPHFLPPVDCPSLAGRRPPQASPEEILQRGVPHLGQMTILRVLATAYSSAANETDETPDLTATNRMVRKGIIALSRDLLREFTPGAPFGFGDHVEIQGVGRFVVEDTMSPRHRQRVDIWCPTREEAMAWGTRRVDLKLVRGRKGTAEAEPADAAPANEQGGTEGRAASAQPS